nr:hypothetical protein [Tanacetum cinerariifolium]
MAKLAFYDYHNMVAILEKTVHNTDFHQIVDFLEASHIRTVELFASMLVPQDKTAFPIGDVSYGEAFPTDTGLDAGHDRENISKTSATPYEALPRVTSLGGGEGSTKPTQEHQSEKPKELSEEELKKMIELAANLSNHTPESLQHLNSICYDDDDDEEKTIPLRLSHHGDEDLSTIPEKESDDVIKSSVEDLVLIPSESDDTSKSDSECDLPSCDDCSPIDVPEGKSVTFSKPLFDSNDDFISSDDESLCDEDVPEDNVKIYSNSLFELDDEYISSDVNPLFDKVLEDIESKASYDSNLDEPALLVTPLFDSNEDECFELGGDVD